MRVTVHGARGSLPVSGPRTRRYGGQTPCVSVETAEGLLIIDAGTGMAALSEKLAARGGALPPITLLLTHLHLDHVVGLTALLAFLDKRARVAIMADATVLADWPAALKRLIGKPFWPVNLLESGGASVRIRPLPPASKGLRACGLQVSWCPVLHPQGCVSYRLTGEGATVVLATDREHGDAGLDRRFLEFCRGADVLVHDAQYTPEEYPARAGWGHTTWEVAARVAAKAKVGKLVLSSHDPSRSDTEVDRIVERARGLFRRTVGAAENLALV